MLKECKGQCDHLIVGLQTNPNKDRPEKNIPIQSLEERWGQLEAIKYIDDVIVYETEDDLIQLLTDIQADIRFIGADWKGGKYTGWELDIPVIFNSRDHSFSTSELRQRIFQSEQKNSKKLLDSL
jgi:glycerol-3-phosphate cytidylyltransferase